MSDEEPLLCAQFVTPDNDGHLSACQALDVKPIPSRPRSTGPAAILGALQGGTKFASNVRIVGGQSLSLTTSSFILNIRTPLGCLISHLLPLPFNPPKESGKVQSVVSPNGRGTLLTCNVLCLSACE
jgi:hypothetical protein